MQGRFMLVACLLGACAPAATGERPSSEPTPTDVTPNTIRLWGPTLYAAPTAITQATYAATHAEDRPHAIALVRADRQADAMLAASRITHFPVNAPVLFVEPDRLPSETRAEIERLGPDGNTYDNDVQVYLVGPIGPAVRREVEAMGLEVRAFPSPDPFQLAEDLDRWAAAVHADHPDEVVVVQYRALATGLPAVAWNAHMGHGLAFVDGDEVPPATRRILERRYGGPYVYLFGDPSVISDRAAGELARYGHVQRVGGADPAAIALTFAGFRDAGIDQGYWLFSSTRDFGWGIAEAGHNFTFVSPDDWQLAVTGSLLSHLGKHGPMLLLEQGRVEVAMARYLQLVQPRGRSVADPLVNHGWILGGERSISREVQADLDLLLGD